jgi:hypothetical protein
MDQQNVREKSYQVMAMGDIFASAKCVFACIGRMTDSVAHMFDTAEEISNQDCYESGHCDFCSRNAGNEASGLGKHQFHLVHTWLDAIEFSRFDDLAEAFDDFGNIEYWNRLWVIQELSLAAEVRVLSAQTEIRLPVLVLIQNIFRETEYGQDGALGSIISGKGLDQNKWQNRVEFDPFFTMCDRVGWCDQLDLGDHLHKLPQLECDDARDRIFGLLRVIKWPADRGPPTPDYNIQPVDLAIDVLDRLGRDWRFLEQVEWLLEAVGFDLNSPANHGSIKCSERLVSANETNAFGVTHSSCPCNQPLMPRIAMQLATRHFATIYLGRSGTMLVTIRSKTNTHQHVELDFYKENGTDFTIVETRRCNRTHDHVNVIRESWRPAVSNGP